jgi:hypothetical protein
MLLLLYVSMDVVVVVVCIKYAIYLMTNTNYFVPFSFINSEYGPCERSNGIG